jgi:transcriptional regulator NrdR family protein
MKCGTCGAWTEVKETRKQDRGMTLRRTRKCANNHRFFTFEVLGPIYKKDPGTVRQTVVAAEVRAVSWRRDRELLAMCQRLPMASVCEAENVGMAALKKACSRARADIRQSGGEPPGRRKITKGAAK